MKNGILFIAMLTITSFIYGQRSSYDLSIQLGSSFRTINTESEFQTDNRIIETQGLHERKMNYNIELGYNYKINNQWVVKTGFNYSTQNYYTSKLTDSRWPSEHDGNDGFVDDPNLPNDLIGTINRSFAGVPLLLRYQMSNCNLSPYIEVGPSLMVLTNSSFEDNFLLENTVISTAAISDNYNNFNVFGRATIGINYTLSSQAQMFGGITYNQQLNNIWKEDFTERLNSYGLQVGMRVKFGQQRRCCKPKSCCPKSEAKSCGDKPE